MVDVVRSAFEYVQMLKADKKKGRCKVQKVSVEFGSLSVKEVSMLVSSRFRA